MYHVRYELVFIFHRGKYSATQRVDFHVSTDRLAGINVENELCTMIEKLIINTNFITRMINI